MYNLIIVSKRLEIVLLPSIEKHSQSLNDIIENFVSKNDHFISTPAVRNIGRKRSSACWKSFKTLLNEKVTLHLEELVMDFPLVTKQAQWQQFCIHILKNVAQQFAKSHPYSRL